MHIVLRYTVAALMATSFLLIMGSSVLGQCDDVEIQDAFEPACGMGLLKGQSFSVASSGELHSVRLAVCTGTDVHLVVRQYNGDGATWFQGAIVGEADAILTATGEPSDCLLSASGYTGYEDHTFNFTALALEGGVTYTLHLNEGVAASGCTISYDGGTAFSSSQASTDQDLAIAITHCPIPAMVFGCTDLSACNYNFEANADDGSCLAFDCANVCGGSAYLDSVCGCVDSIDDADSCWGCTDSSACNYDETASADDGSCALPDCNGDCAGSAVSTACGCIGGETGLDINSCIDGCSTDIISNTGSACTPGLLFGQSFTSESTGLLKKVSLRVCCALDAQLALRSYMNPDPCLSGGPWNTGDILGLSNSIESTCNGLTSCLTSNGTSGYQYVTFDFENIPIEEGTSYVLELVNGVAVSACDSDYPGGTAFNSSAALENYDLLFSIYTCPDETVIFGCNDLAACNYNNTATDNDGSCLFTDCNGDCGGVAQSVSGCGCIGGMTGIVVNRCVDGNLLVAITNDEEICSANFYGQTFTADHDGFFKRLSMIMAPFSSQSIRVVRIDGPLDGLEVGTAFRNALAMDNCISDAPDWQDMDFETAIPLESGSQYQIEIITGSGKGTCSADYANGHALNSNLSSSAQDMAFRIMDRTPLPNELVWGCTDETACNYDINHTHENGTCLFLDCNNECGGTAYMVNDCGCVGGSTGYAEAACYGCTHPLACNYDADVPIDDGSCGEVDCNGECSGTAFEDPQCGCIGGNTGTDPASCLDKCQGMLSLSTYLGGSPDFSTTFSGSGQTFTAGEDAFLTSSRFRNLYTPDGDYTFELRSIDANNVNQGTLLVSETHDSSTNDESLGVNIFIEWNSPVLLIQGQMYALVVYGANCAALVHEEDVYTGGASFSSSNASATSPDLFLELFTCDDLYGCNDPTACNYEDWATADAGTCWAYCGDPAAVNYDEAADPSCTNNDYCNYCDPPFDWDITTTDYSGHVISCPDSADGTIEFQVTDPNLTIDRVHFLRDGYYQSQSEGNSGGYINLIPGTYAAVGINDEFACHDTIQILVDEPEPIVWSGLGMTAAPSALGIADGEVEANWSGGASTALNGGSLLFANIDPDVVGAAPQFTTTMNGDHVGPAPAGWQMVVARDANGCWAEGPTGGDALQFMDFWGENPPFPATARVQLIMIPFSICD